jgi:hypothetical protein
LNTFAQDTAGVLEAVRAVRALTAARGHDPAVWITELGWATGGPPSAFRVSEARQARLVERTLITLGARREGLGLRGVYFKLEGLTAYRDGRDFFGLHTGLIRRMEREARALGL